MNEIENTNGSTNGSEASGRLLRAVIYIRVSTKDQAERGGEIEGFSIPAQREACYRKATALGAEVVEEFLDAGESAKSADRAQLQRMLGYIDDNDVDMLIVHKVDRLARNRADDVMIGLALQAARVRLVSCSENIDETPSGKLLHGIMASIAEFYSRNLGTEALKGMQEKARRGGTVARAPIGYINVGKLVNGREMRTVEFNPGQAELMKWAFEAYATGEWTLASLQEELTARGLLTKPSARRAAGPLALSRLSAALRNRYYVGKVVFKGVEYDGNHEPLIELETFNKVQGVLDSHRFGEKERVHHHYLKGTVFCGACGSRLCITTTTNRHGTVYPYYFCLGRHQKRTDCTFRSVQVSVIESLVEAEWSKLIIDPKYGALLQEMIEEEAGKLTAKSGTDSARDVRQLQVLRERRHKLLDAFYAGAITTDMLKAEQVGLTSQIEGIELRMARSHVVMADLEFVLGKTLQFLYEPQATYLAAPVALRRQLNQTVWERIDVIEGEGLDELDSKVQEPFASLLSADLVVNMHGGSEPVAASWAGGAPSWLSAQAGWASLTTETTPSVTGTTSGKPQKQQTRKPGAAGSKADNLVTPRGIEPLFPG